MPHSKKNIVILTMLVMAALSKFVFAATYYVSPTGSDATGNGSNANPWKTPKYGCAHMSGGDTLILKDGVYTDSTPSTLGCDNQIRPPNGTSGNYTTIKAENDWKAIINWSWYGSTQDGDVPIRIYEYGTTRSYVAIEGIRISSATSAVYIRNANHIKLKKIAVIAAPASGSDASGYGEPFAINGDCHYVLLEDSWASGCIRYGVKVQGEYDTVGGKNTDNVIIRRVVVRMDYKASTQPKACFSAYGAYDDTYGTTDNIIFQNCIAIDWNPEPGMTDTYGGFYAPHRTKGIKWEGCIALNLRPGSSGTHGFYALDDKRENWGPSIITNCIVCDVRGHGIYWDRGGEYEVRAVTATADQCTIMFTTNPANTSRYAYDHMVSGDYIKTSITNSILDTADSNTTNLDSENYNCYNPASLKPAGALNSITDDNGLKYITRVENTSPCKGTGQGGKDIGANVVNRYGASGTLWGEAGYDTLTADSLWPWPYESQIQSDFRTENVSTSSPTVNNTNRGFCAPGTTLTKYIWEYLGNAMPAGIYDLTPPTDLLASTTSENMINLTWTDDCNVETGFKIERGTAAGGPFAQIGLAGENSGVYADYSVEPDTMYYYRVRSYNSGGDSAYSGITSTQTVLNPPSGLDGIALTTSIVRLEWIDNSAIEGGFRIERKLNDTGDYVFIASAAANSVTYTDNGLTADNTYYYRMQTYKDNHVSSYSNMSVVFISVYLIPKPSSLNAVALSTGSIALAWTDNASNETGFKVERKMGSAGTYSEVAVLGENVKAFSDSGLDEGSTYYYRVRAYNSISNSDYSSEVSAVTRVITLDPPTGFIVVSVSTGSVRFSWTDPSAYESGFSLERKTGATGTYSEVAQMPANAVDFKDGGLSTGNTYYYRIRTCRGSSYSAYSAEVKAVTHTALTTNDITEAYVVKGEVKIVGSTERRGVINPDEGGTAKIYFTGAGTGMYECRIFTLNGLLVWENSMQNVSSGMFEWIPGDVASGGYIVAVKGPGIDVKKKVAIVR